MKAHDVQQVEFEGKNLVLTVDGKTYQIDLESVSGRLARAQENERRHFEVSPSGYGIHWPIIDEDLTVNGLIAAASPNYPKTHGETLLMKEDAPKDL